MILLLYRLLTTLLAPLIRLTLAQRMRRGKEDAHRLPERMGIAARPRPPGTLVWLHAASVGEAVSMLPIIAALQARPGHTVLMTTGTVTSAAVMAERLPAGAIHQFVPVDRVAWARRFLDHWRPDLALWCESEFWPNLLLEIAARRIPAILLNGRVSDRSFARWRHLPGVIRPLLACFVLCLGQSERDAGRLTQLGARNTAFLGNLKFAAPPLHADRKALADLQEAAGDRPRWLAASTHDGEELLAGRLHRRLQPDFPGLLTIIVPRHPGRGDAIARELAAQGFRLAQRSKGGAIAPGVEIYLADSMGELGLFVRLAPLVFMGKSLIGQGGQNPLEPARLRASVLFGPHMANFIDIARRMREAGAATQVADEGELAKALSARLADAEMARREGEAAQFFASHEDGVLPAVIGAIDAWLPQERDAIEELHEGLSRSDERSEDLGGGGGRAPTDA
jgi:3-deoxy-D-manno-octulosonic-acid transferase